MRHRLMPRLIAVALLLVSASALVAGGRGLAQEQPVSELLIRASFSEGDFPVAPALVRLLRINLDPEASSPAHTHTGPEIGLVETGIATVQVGGPANLSIPSSSEATPTSETEAPIDSEFEIGPGDQIAYLPGTPLTFRNGGTEPLSILTVSITPWGHQHPEGTTYVGGQPDASQFQGIAPEIFGDGIATRLPVGGAVVTVDRYRVPAGAPIPAFDGPILLSLDQGIFDFTVIGGKVQPFSTLAPGAQGDSPPGMEVSLSKGDAVFFPLGMKEVARTESDGELVLLRLTITPTDNADQPTPSADGMGEIEVAAPAPAATPQPGEGSPVVDGEVETPAPQASPTSTPDDGTSQVGDTVVINSDGVNVRAGAGTGFEVVTQLFIGQTVTITGPAEDDGEYIWWPISVDDDPSLTGYIAQDFFDPLDEGA